MQTEEDNIVIEVLDSSQIPENELKYFEETQPIEIENIIIENIDKVNVKPECSFKPKPIETKLHETQESEEILIQKYVNGEVAFNEFYTSIDNDENDEDDEDETLAWERDILEEISENDLKKDFKKEIQTDQYSAFKEQTTKEEPQKQRKEKRKRSILTPALQGLMGEANLSFVRGQIAIAEKICLEIIRQNPLTSEPFFTLAQIYENKDDDKYLGFLSIAAHLDPTNRDQWVRIAEINIERKNYQQARKCYSKAIKFFPKDYELRIMKARLLEMTGDEHKAMFTLMKMIITLPSEKYEYCLVTAKNVARYFHKHQRVSYALEAMQSAYKVAKEHFTPEDINLYLELLILNKFYHKVLTVLKDYAKIEYITEMENDEIIVVACVFPDDMPSEFRIKACVCLVHLKAFHLIHYITSNILEFVDLDSNIEGYIDVAEAMMSEGKYVETIVVLEEVIENSTEIPPYVWLRYAESNCAIDNFTKAISSYQTVVELAPFCYDAKFALSTLLKKQGKHKEAIKALEQDLDAETFNPRILLEYCLMLKQVNEIDQYIEGAYILLARNSLKFRTREEMLQASAGANNYKSSTIKSIVEWRLESGNKKDDAPALDNKDNESMLSSDEEYDLFKDVLKVCYTKQKYSTMQKLCFAMITSRRFRTKFKELEKLIILTSLYNDDSLIAFMFLREILSRNPQKKIYWNLSNILIQKYDSVRYYRYFKRLLDRVQTESYFKIFLANYHLSAGSYKYALNLYVSIFKDTNDPLLALCITVVFSQMSTQKNSLKKQTAAAQAIAFAKKYSELRLTSITEQEVYYNLGRIYHHSGLLNLAIKYYTQALEVKNKFILQNDNILDLREETAFNLHLIYKACGNYDMARKYLYKYITI